ncbi:hypothetical protein BDV98DRAFT_595580 [Pterulicium gracile]|uniref:Pectin lyase fold/virulence factor n=1 Tax=Pterulicium gracile TaxID=1884261 RepID=A0A5C3QC67_9AGAR|nr:hypothetical protein BDV98DRAFT_595580 [Pterula gracilis]
MLTLRVAPFGTSCTVPLLAGTANANDPCWLETTNHQGISAFHSAPASYHVFRNVKSFGARGDDVTDDTAAMNGGYMGFTVKSIVINNAITGLPSPPDSSSHEGAEGDGRTYDTAALKAIFAKYSRCKITFFDIAHYVIASTLEIPVKKQMTGGVWFVITAKGVLFGNVNSASPSVTVRAGAAGAYGFTESWGSPTSCFLQSAQSPQQLGTKRVTVFELTAPLFPASLHSFSWMVLGCIKKPLLVDFNISRDKILRAVKHGYSAI